MKLNRALYILERGFFGVALPNNHALDTKRVCNKSVWVLFNNDLKLIQHCLILALSRVFKLQKFLSSLQKPKTSLEVRVFVAILVVPVPLFIR